MSDPQFEQCEQCHAPVERDQRYCVNCGAHRRHVPDPAAKYMSRAGAGTGPLAGAGVGAVTAATTGAPRPGGINLLGAAALALIPVAAVLGLLIGRSSNDRESRLISALEHYQAQTPTVVGATAAAGTSASASNGTNQPAAKTKRHGHRHATGKGSKVAASTATQHGKVTKITGFKATAQEQAQGSQEAAQIQKSTGKNYVQASNNLPSTVVVGP